MPTEPSHTAFPVIDRTKLRAKVRRLGDEYAFYLLDEAIEVMTQEQLARVIARYFRAEELRPDPANQVAPRTLLEDVRDFDTRSRAGAYYQRFDVNSRNCTQLSVGTRSFIVDCARILDRCIEASDGPGKPATAEAFEIVFDLLRTIDEAPGEVIFLADEHGSWQVGVEWPRVFPAWFTCLAAVASPEAYAARVVTTVEEFEHYEWEKRVDQALRAASPEQRVALTALAARPRRRR